MAPFKGVLSGVVSEKRPMDNMKLSLDVPQEDELATNVRTRLRGFCQVHLGDSGWLIVYVCVYRSVCDVVRLIVR